MEYIEPYLPKTPTQVKFTAASAAVIAVYVLGSLLKKKKELKGKVVVITGASSGIGKALAHEFVKNGCKVILVARSMDKLERLKEELIECYRVGADSVSPFFLDLEDHGSVPEACQAMIALYGRVDILINNAGLISRSLVINTELDIFKKIMNINYFGQIALTKGLLPHMIEQGGGTIVAVSSLQGRIAIPTMPAYGASKHALQGFCDSLRHENSRHKIDVLVISPSYVATNLGQAAISGTGKPLDGKSLNLVEQNVQSGMSAEYCATEIVHAIKNCETDYLIGPFTHRLMVYIRALCPSIYNWYFSRM